MDKSDDWIRRGLAKRCKAVPKAETQLELFSVPASPGSAGEVDPAAESGGGGSRKRRRSRSGETLLDRYLSRDLPDIESTMSAEELALYRAALGTLNGVK